MHQVRSTQQPSQSLLTIELAVGSSASFWVAARFVVHSCGHQFHSSPALAAQSWLWGWGFGLGNLHHRGHARSGGHINQGVERKQVYLAAHQVRHTGLSHPEQGGGFALRHAAFSDDFGQSHHQRRAGLHAGRLLGRVFQGIPDAGEALVFRRGQAHGLRLGAGQPLESRLKMS